jgi:hypothetical protein
MSARNGDKARFGRLRKQRILLRKRIREMRDAMESKTTTIAIGASEYDSASSRPLKPMGEEVGQAEVR